MANPTPTPPVLASSGGLLKYRVYTSDNSFKSLQKVSYPGGEIHVCLAFARDFDKHGKYNKGQFVPYFDETKVTPEIISNFKTTSVTTAKFFLSIGGHDSRFSFSLKPTDKDIWISKAVDSLEEIIKKYQIDGLDIYYNHIESPMFADAIGSVIKQLYDDKKVIKEVSISPSASLNESYYYNLFQNYETYITTVAYQSQYEVKSDITSVGLLKQLFETLVNTYYPKEKLLAGHTINPANWSTVSLSLFLAAIPDFLAATLGLPGISLWTVFSHDPEK